MSDPMGLSIGTTNLVAARVGNEPVTRRSVLNLPSGLVMGSFVERVGDSVPLIAADGSAYSADRMLVEALTTLITGGGQSSPDIVVAVPAYWGPATKWALRNAMRAEAALAPNGIPARLVSDAVASLTALHADSSIPAQGVVALLDFGGGGTSVTVADAAAGFEPIAETTRYPEFSGDLVDQALLGHVLDGIAMSGQSDPADTAAVESLTKLREECCDAKERLSTVEVTEFVVELPGYRSTVTVTRAELEALIDEPLAGVLAALDTTLQRNGIGWQRVGAVATAGGGAAIPLIGRRLLEHVSAPVYTTPQPALDAAIGAALIAGYGAAAEAQTGLAPVVPADTGSSTFLAWSQDDDAAAEPVTYAETYDSDVASTRSAVQYVPASGPIDEPPAWQRLPGLVFGLAATVALIAVGGVAIALTSATDSTEVSDPPRTVTSAPGTSAAPPSSPQVQTVTATSAPPSPESSEPVIVQSTTVPPVTTVQPTTTAVTTTAPTTTITTTTRPTSTTTTTSTTTSTTASTTRTSPTTTPRTPTTTPTTYLTVPFVPIPIPIPAPQNP
jgi:actin-like ATPase involved in cell morphogenesis